MTLNTGPWKHKVKYEKYQNIKQKIDKEDKKKIAKKIWKTAKKNSAYIILTDGSANPDTGQIAGAFHIYKKIIKKKNIHVNNKQKI